VNGILFNHESPRRGETFASRKITRAVGRIKHGLQDRLYTSTRSATGATPRITSRRCGTCSSRTPPTTTSSPPAPPTPSVLRPRQLDWQGSGVSEQGLERGTNRTLVEIDPRYLRPTEVDLLLGDATKARQNLGWTPTTTFEQLVDIMVDHDVELAADEAHLKTRR
jgi:GDPmannose 4,6-dehydratase